MKKHTTLKLGLALALTAALCVIVLAVSAFATDYPVTTADEFKDAVAAATGSDPSNIILQNDIAFDAAYNIKPTASGGTVNVSAPAGESYTVTLAGLCELQSSVTLQINEGVTFDFNETSRFYVNPGATFILNGGTVTNGRGTQGGGLYGAAGCNVYIYDGTIQNCASTSSSGGGVFVTSTSAAPSNFTMSGGTITGCTSSTLGGGLVFGGGYVNITITGGTITGNTSTTYGGGMYLYGVQTAPITGLTVSNNTALGSGGSYNYGGGGIAIEGTAKYYTLGAGTVITGNTAEAGRGGGIAIVSAKSCVLDGVEISGNHATSSSAGHCGGVFVNGGNLTVQGTTLIDGNDAVSRAGGIGCQISTTSSVTIAGGTISNNTSGTQAGGVEASYGTFTMTGGTITGNTSGTYAGGLLVSTAKGCTITGGTVSNNTSTSYAGGVNIANAATNSVSGLTVTNNTAGTSGGGLYIGSAVVDLTISDANITGNSATNSGGGVYFYGSKGVTVEDTTFENNRAGANGGAFWGSSSSVVTVTGSTVSHNVSYGGGGAVLTSGTLNIEDTEFKGNACGVYYEGDTFKVRGSGWGGSAIYVDGTGTLSLKDVTITGNGNAGQAVFAGNPSSGKNTMSFDGVCVIKENSNGVSSYDEVTGKYLVAAGEKETGVLWTLGKSGTLNFNVKDTVSASSDVLLTINFSKTSTDTFVGTVVDSAGDPSTTDISAALANFATAYGVCLAQEGSDIVLDGTTPVSYTVVSVNNGASVDINVLDLGEGVQAPTQADLVATFTDAPEAGSPFEGRAYSNGNFVGFADVTGYGTASPVLNALYFTEQKGIPGADLDGKTIYAAWANAKTVPGASIKITGDGASSGIRFLTILETDPMAAIGIKNLSETEWDNGDVGYVFGVTMTKDYGETTAKSQTYQGAGGKLFTDVWFGDELYDASYDNRGTNHVFSFGLNLTSSQYEYAFTPTSFVKIQYTDGAVGNRTTPVPTEGDPAAAIVRTARGVARSYAEWLVSASNPDLDKDNLGLQPAQIGALEAIADGTFDLGNKTYANN